jgi:hypothetical protein
MEKTHLKKIMGVIIIVAIIVSINCWLLSQDYYIINKSSRADVWIDGDTNETVVNRTITVVVTKVYSWKHEVVTTLTFSFEVFRSRNASEAIQKAIDKLDVIFFYPGSYKLSTTIFLDNYTTLVGGNFTSRSKTIFDASNSTHIIISHCNVTMIEGKDYDG